VSITWPGHDDAVGMISSVAAGPDGVYYALHRGPGVDPVLAINAEGAVLRSWGAGLYAIPHSIRLDPEGNVWTVDSGSSQVYKFSPEGEQLLHIDVGEMPEKDSAFRGTADIAFASDGSLFIADGYGNARVLEYSAAGERIRAWGKPGTGPGEFHLPHAIAIDENDIIYVGDRENGRIQRFDRQGKYLGEWDGLGRTYSLFLASKTLWLGAARLDEPTGSPGWLLRLDRETGEVVEKMDSAGTHSITLGADGTLLTGVRPNGLLRFRQP
jgi:DNA-binding beta-propeller fold protein YncE